VLVRTTIWAHLQQASLTPGPEEIKEPISRQKSEKRDGYRLMFRRGDPAKKTPGYGKRLEPAEPKVDHNAGFLAR